MAGMAGQHGAATGLGHVAHQQAVPAIALLGFLGQFFHQLDKCRDGPNCGCARCAWPARQGRSPAAPCRPRGSPWHSCQWRGPANSPAASWRQTSFLAGVCLRSAAVSAARAAWSLAVWAWASGAEMNRIAARKAARDIEICIGRLVLISCGTNPGKQPWARPWVVHRKKQRFQLLPIHALPCRRQISPAFPQSQPGPRR